MLKRLLLVAFCILFLPVLVSLSHSKSAQVAGPAAVAFAGHSNMGGEGCTCGCPGCICDPGESPSCAGTTAANGQSDDMTLGDKTPTPEANYGAAALFVALALSVWLRLRT